MESLVTQNEKHEKRPELWVLLHNIRSQFNVGSIFRTADAVGAKRILISGYTPRPVDRFGREVKEISKTALGAERSVPWSSYETWNEAVSFARSEGFKTLALEQDERSVDYKKMIPAERTLIVLGEEVDGVTLDLRNDCDAITEIPMKGAKESLNVSVAFGILAYRLADR